ncbi:MAG: asparagine synthase-related protein [Limisphaerales bacterium]
MFSDILLLPPGSAWTFSSEGKLTKHRYFDPASWEAQPPLSPAKHYERLKEAFPRILRRYLNGEQPVAMSLTGGLDGRMIMAWSPRGTGELPCYTFNGPFRECADVKIARKVASVCGQSHQMIPVGDQFYAEFPALAEKAVYISDGAMDVSGSVELYVNRLAREVAPIRMTGNYGSEILRGNVAFKPSPLAEAIYNPQFVDLGRRAAEIYTQESRTHPVSFIAFKQVPWHHRSRLSVEQSQLTLRTPYLDNELVALMYQAPPELVRNNEPSLRLIADGNPALSRIPTDRGLLYRPLPLATRARRSYQEFTIKAEYAYDYGMPQWLARVDHTLEPLRLERLFLGRHKFYHFRIWYRRGLANYLKAILLNPRSGSRSYLKGALLEPLLMDHLSGRRNFTLEIHRILSMELVHRTLIESA